MSGSIAPDTAQRPMGLRTMLSLFSAVALGVTLAVGATAYWGSQQMEDTARQTFVAKDVTADILPPPMYLIELRLVLSQAVEGTITAEQAGKELQRLKGEYETRVAHWRTHSPFGLEAQLLGEQHAAGAIFIDEASKMVALMTAAAKSDAAALRAQLRAADAAYVRHRAGVDATVKESVAFAEASVASFDRATTAMLVAKTVVVALGAVGLIGFGLWIRRRVWAAVGGEPADVAALAKAVAAGDLTVSVPLEPGDRSSIVAALRTMVEGLAALVGTVRTSSDSIATGSAQIATGNADLSQRTEEQASNLEQTAASMEQLTATVKQNSDTARQANQLAASASTAAERGGAVVSQVVGTMQDISDSSKKIADIIGVIDGIAFQTNILALNAAVEAARAGEQGRGFAVVASEVRSLAQRSANAAKEIKALIGHSVAKVDDGTRLVDAAGASMTDIVAQVKRVTDLIAEISSASIEQTQGISQVGDAVTQLDQVTQQNAALVEQSAAAADSLKQQASALARTVAVFKV